MLISFIVFFSIKLFLRYIKFKNFDINILKFQNYPVSNVLLLFSFIVYAMLSAIWSGKLATQNIEYMAKLIEGFIIIILVLLYFDFDNLFPILKKYISFIFLIICIIVLIEVTFGIHLKEINPNHIRPKLTDLPAALYYNTLNLATIIAILLPFFFVYWQRNISQTSATFLFILLSLTMIVLSTSRTAITVTFINLFLLIYFNNKRKKILILFLLLITAAYFIITIFYPSTVNTIIDKFQFKDGSTSLRTTLYKTALKLFPSNIFGLGPGSAELFYQNSINININAHSTWLEIFINFGIVGFILFNLFHFSVIYKLYGILKFYKKNHPASTNDKIYHSQVMASIVILFTLPLLTFAGSSIIRSLSILWLLYGYILILIKHNYKYNNSMFIH